MNTQKKEKNSIPVIHIDHVSKSFGKKEILSDLQLTIPSTGIYALLGRNGTGKTTLMHLLNGRYVPTKGTLQIFGEPAIDNIPILSRICYQSDRLIGFDYLNTSNVLAFAKTFYPKWDDSMEQTCIDLFHLDLKQLYGKLSKGMQSAVSITIGLSSRADLTLLDEIHTGLDAAIRQEFYQLLLNDYIKHPRTYIIATHLIHEMVSLFDHVIILKDTQILLHTSLEELQANAYECIGNTNLLEALSGKNILSSSTFFASTKAILFDTLTSSEIKQFKQQNITIRPLGLQEIFIALTDKKTEEM